MLIGSFVERSADDAHGTRLPPQFSTRRNTCQCSRTTHMSHVILASSRNCSVRCTLLVGIVLSAHKAVLRVALPPTSATPGLDALAIHCAARFSAY